MAIIRKGVLYDKSTGDLADAFGLTDAHIRRLAAGHKIPSIQVGRRYWFNLGQVEPVLVRDSADLAQGVADASDIGALLQGL